MYIIAVYDVNSQRVAKVLKLFRQYLHWIQNSVFEGELSEGRLQELKDKASELMNPDEDSIIFFIGRSEKWLEKEIMGLEKNSRNTIL
jgi:CRISPR-associated protein Cas2